MIPNLRRRNQISPDRILKSLKSVNFPWTVSNLSQTRQISLTFPGLGGKPRADSRLAPSQWEPSLQSNAVSHWLGTNLESALQACVGWDGGLLRIDVGSIQLSAVRGRCHTDATINCETRRGITTHVGIGRRFPVATLVCYMRVSNHHKISCLFNN